MVIFRNSITLTSGNLSIATNSITSTDTDGNINITPDGTGDINLSADTITVGDSNLEATISSNGNGILKLKTGGSNQDIILHPDGTGSVQTFGGIKFNANNDYVLLKSSSASFRNIRFNITINRWNIRTSITNGWKWWIKFW